MGYFLDITKKQGVIKDFDADIKERKKRQQAYQQLNADTPNNNNQIKSAYEPLSYSMSKFNNLTVPKTSAPAPEVKPDITFNAYKPRLSLDVENGKVKTIVKKEPVIKPQKSNPGYISAALENAANTAINYIPKTIQNVSNLSADKVKTGYANNRKMFNDYFSQNIEQFNSIFGEYTKLPLTERATEKGREAFKKAKENLILSPMSDTYTQKVPKEILNLSDADLQMVLEDYNVKQKRQDKQDKIDDKYSHLNPTGYKAAKFVGNVLGEEAVETVLTLGMDKIVDPIKYGAKAVDAVSDAVKVATKVDDVKDSVSFGKKAVEFLKTAPVPTKYTLISGGNVALDKYEQNVLNGADRNEAFLNALGTGYISSLTEKLGFEELTGVAGKINKGVTGSFEKSLGRIFANYGMNAASEGFEEVLDNVIGGAWDKATIYPEITWGEIFDPKTNFESFAGGAMIGTILGGLGTAYSVANLKTDSNNVKQKIDTLNEVNKTLPEELRLKNLDNDSDAKAVNEYTNNLINTFKTEKQKISDIYKSGNKEQIQKLNETYSEVQPDTTVNNNSIKNIENNPKTSKTISSLSRIMGGAEVSETDIESLIQNSEIFEVYTGKAIKENAETEIRQYLEEMNKKNARANSIISAISDKTGLAFDYDITLPEKVAGFYDAKNKKIVLNPAHKDALDYAVVHELTHFVENKKGYSAYRKSLLKSNAYQEFLLKENYADKKEFRTQLEKDYKKVYGHLSKDEFNEAIDYEIAAKISEYLINSEPAALKRIANKDTGIKAIFRDIMEFFNEIIHKLSGESEKAYAMKMARKFRELAGDNDVQKGKEFIQYSNKNSLLTANEVKIIQSIGRKSINKLSSEELRKLEIIAEKYYKDMGVKSPFFRAWFGDWREYDNTVVEIYKIFETKQKNPRGQYLNKDTGFLINSSSIGYDETVSHSGKDKMSIIAMENIDKIIENAILLDTEISEYGRGKKSIYTCLMHKFYSYVYINEKPYIAKMTVDESYQPGAKDTNKKFYHVRAIKIEPASSVGIGFNHTPIMEKSNSKIMVSDLFKIVKQNDSEFNPNPSSLVLNEDGTPKILYHGTQEFGFSVFDPSKSDDETSIFLTSNNDLASTYSGVTGERKLSEVYDKDIDAMSIEEIVNTLNTSDYATKKGDVKYNVYDSEKLDKLVSEVNSEIFELSKQVNKKIEEYENINKLIVDEKASKIIEQLYGLQNSIEKRDYDFISGKLYALLHYSSVFDEQNTTRFETLDKKMRLMQILKDNKSIEKNIIKDSLNGVDFEIISITEAKGMLLNSLNSGNYALYVKAENPLVVECNGKHWNNIGYETTEGEILDKTREISKYAKEKGYDSGLFKNIIDNGGLSHDVKLKKMATDVYVVFSAEQLKSATDNIGTFDKNNPDIQYSITKDSDTSDLNAIEKPEAQKRTMLISQNNDVSKIEDIRHKASQKIFKEFSIPLNKRKKIKSLINIVLEDDIEKGNPVSSTKDENDFIFNLLEKNSKVVDDSVYNQYKDLKELIRTTKLHFSEEVRKDFSEAESFRKSNMGTLSLNQNEGRGIDDFYQELCSSYPDVFSDKIINSADQLREISDVAKSISKENMSIIEAGEKEGLTREYFENILKSAYNEHFISYFENEVRKGSDKITNKQKQKYIELKSGRPYGELTELEMNDYNSKLNKEIENFKKNKDVDTVEKILNTVDKKSNNIIDTTEYIELFDGAPDIDNYTLENFRSVPAQFIKGNQLGMTFDGKDIYRNNDMVSNKSKEVRTWLSNLIERPLEDAKGDYVDRLKDKVNYVYDTIVKELGIEMGSKESAAVQWYGEGLKPQKKGNPVSYTLQDLKTEFPDKWEDIVKADKLLRKMYNDYIDEINTVLKQVYPNVEKDVEKLQKSIDTLREKMDSLDKETKNKADKKIKELEERIDNLYTNRRLRPRKDYYRHFQEEGGGISSLMNILKTDIQISPDLIKVSENTKPLTKWWGALQHRQGDNNYKADGVGAILNYIPNAEYKIHIEPFIGHMRKVINSFIKDTTLTKNANGYIQFLTEWTNDLAGKTNTSDRVAQNKLSRRIMNVVGWVGGRARANAIVGNLRTAVVQVFNLPNATMYIKNPKDWGNGIKTMILDARTGGNIINQSVFLKERYLDDVYSKFKKGIKYTPEKLCNLMLTAGDKAATTYIWYSAYSEGVRKKLDNPRLHADRITRRSVAGRGIGELPLMQKSKVIQAIAPFQVEVSNSWEIMKEKGKQGDLIAFLLYSASAWALNSLAEFVFGDKVIPDIVDIISDMIDKFKDDEPIEKNIGQATLRAGGGIMSAMPYASVIASAFIPDEELRSEIFGDDDPSRYGVGVFGLEQITNLAVKGIAGNLEEDDIIDFAASYVLPMGGKQIARSYKGYKDISAGGSYTNKGQLRFPITTTVDKARTLMFGAYSTKKGQEYLEKLKPLGDKQTKIFKQLINLHNGKKYQDEIFYTFKGYSEYKKEQGKTILSKKDREKYVNIMSPLSDMPESEHIREWFINNVDSQEKTK